MASAQGGGEVKREEFWEYPNIPNEVICRRCKKELLRSDLVVSYDVEFSHPFNRGKNVLTDEMHKTKFEDCPFCETTLYADGKKL